MVGSPLQRQQQQPTQTHLSSGCRRCGLVVAGVILGLLLCVDATTRMI